MGKFGWDLPPGCSMNDIERAFGDQPNLQETFESQEKMSEAEAKLFEDWCNDTGKLGFLDRLMNWAFEVGYTACRSDDAENRFYEEMYKTQEEEKKPYCSGCSDDLCPCPGGFGCNAYGQCGHSKAPSGAIGK